MWKKVLEVFKGFIAFARVAAPVAKSVAVIAGKDDVVGDIEKAEKAADAVGDGLDKIE